MSESKKSTGKGWIRTLKTWMALTTNPEQRSVYREAIRQRTMGEYLIQKDTVPLDRGVDGEGKWWGSKKGSY